MDKFKKEKNAMKQCSKKAKATNQRDKNIIIIVVVGFLDSTTVVSFLGE